MRMPLPKERLSGERCVGRFGSRDSAAGPAHPGRWPSLTLRVSECVIPTRSVSEGSWRGATVELARGDPGIRRSKRKGLRGLMFFCHKEHWPHGRPKDGTFYPRLSKPACVGEVDDSCVPAC